MRFVGLGAVNFVTKKGDPKAALSTYSTMKKELPLILSQTVFKYTTFLVYSNMTKIFLLLLCGCAAPYKSTVVYKHPTKCMVQTELHNIYVPCDQYDTLNIGDSIYYEFAERCPRVEVRQINRENLKTEDWPINQSRE